MSFDEPPSVIHSAPVRLYAMSGGSDAWTGTLTVFVDGKLLGPLPRLAICEDLLSSDFLLMYCDENWTPVGVTAGPSLNHVKGVAERAYLRLVDKWQEFRTRSDKELQEIKELRLCLRRLDAEYPI